LYLRRGRAGAGGKGSGGCRARETERLPATHAIRYAVTIALGGFAAGLVDADEDEDVDMMVS